MAAEPTGSRTVSARKEQMWLALTQAEGGEQVHVNMQLVTYMWRLADDETRLVFDKDNYLDVQELPAEIRSRMRSSGPKPSSD
jgi:hypothetical protein